MPLKKEMTNVTFDEIRIGQTAEMTVTLTKNQVDLLAVFSGDVDAYHLKSPEKPGNGKRTEAAGAVALISAVIGTRLPGPGAKILRRELGFSGDIAVGDVLTASVTVLDKKPEGRVVIFDSRCVNQSGHVLIAGLTFVEAPATRLVYDDIAPPHIELRRSDSFMDLFKTCDTCAPVICGVVHPCDRDSLTGAVEAARRSIIEPVLVGPEAKIRKAAEEARVDLGSWRIVSTPHSHASAAQAVELARAGEVEALMKGSLHTDEIMGAIVPSASGMRTSRRVSHAFVMDVPTYHKMFMMTDAAVNIAPTLADKKDIIQNAIDLAHALGIEKPKVGILSAVETVNPSIPSTLDAAALCKMAERGQITGGILDGPLAFDNAISAEAARIKKIRSEVSGDVDILLAPDLESANMLFKQLTYLAGAEGAGIVLGTRIPVVLTSRADTVRTRLASAAVMAIVAQARRTGKVGVT